MIQCSAQVFKRAGRQFSKRAFSAWCSMIKKALTTVISASYQHFDDYFCDGNSFDSSLFTCLTIEDINALPATEQLLEEGKTCLEQLVVTPGMIEAKIKGLKDNKSPGADGISPC